MYDIDTIRVMYLKRAVESTFHFLNRIEKRRIKLSYIKDAILSGEIIEQVLDDYPNPSILVLGYSNKKPLHVVIGIGDDKLWLITAYYPTLELWETDFKTRKEVK